MLPYLGFFHRYFHTSILTLNGIHYWDAQDFNEQSLRLVAGYRWQDIRQDAGLQPFIEQNWLGGARYSQ